MVKQIFVFNGSNSKYSKSQEYIDYLIRELQIRVNFPIKVIKYSGNNLNLNYCKGCLLCFEKLRCPLDNDDNFDEIKVEIQKSDFLILSSPVFMHNINAPMKNFIDRLAYWSHLFTLRGKYGMVIATAGSTGLDIVINYLKKIMRFFGVSIVCSAKLSSANEYYDENTEKYLELILDALSGNSDYDKEIEPIFLGMKMAMRQQGGGSDEYKYWEENNLFKANSFFELLKNYYSDQ